MKERIGLIRHGSTTWNLQGRVQGQIDIELTNEGRMQARLLGQRLRMFSDKWDLMISSDLSRAQETAEIVATFSGIPLAHTDKRLRERNFGQIEGTTEPERIQRFGADWRSLDLDIETNDQLHSRWLDFSDDLAESYGQAYKILLVTHGNYIIELLKSCDYEPQTYLQNTSLTVLEKVNHVWSVHVYNSLWHLGNDANHKR